MIELHKGDTETQVFFYEQDYYCLSNFSSFRVRYAGIDFDTAEHAYHWCKFDEIAPIPRALIRVTRSAHEAFQVAQEYKEMYRPSWYQDRVTYMKSVLRCKLSQHPYVLKKLLATDNRELIEDSWRDNFWGWGPNRDGENMLGKVWTQLREEYRSG